MSRRRWSAGLLLLAACSGAAAAEDLTAVDLEGQLHRPGALAPGAVHVLVFTSHECPIANSYTPTLQELVQRYADHPVRWFVVHVDPDLDVAGARQHRTAYGLPGTVVLDPEQRLARHFGVQRTPEAVVLCGAGLVYRGRIDDQWLALGSRGPVGHADLADAVHSALAGKLVPLPHPPAVGCLLPQPAPR